MTLFITSLTTTVSSAPQASTVCNLNWIGGKPATVQVVSTNATSSCSFTIQYTLDDPQRLGGSSLAFFSNLSSAFSDTTWSNSSASIFSSSSISAEGMIVSFLSPICAVRLNSTSGIANGPLTMRVVQGEGW